MTNLLKWDVPDPKRAQNLSELAFDTRKEITRRECETLPYDSVEEFT